MMPAIFNVMLVVERKGSIKQAAKEKMKKQKEMVRRCAAS
jgi:hypothetical protein